MDQNTHLGSYLAWKSTVRLASNFIFFSLHCSYTDIHNPVPVFSFSQIIQTSLYNSPTEQTNKQDIGTLYWKYIFV